MSEAQVWANYYAARIRRDAAERGHYGAEAIQCARRDEEEARREWEAREVSREPMRTNAWWMQPR